MVYLWVFIIVYFFPFLIAYNLILSAIYATLNMIMGRGFKIGQGGV